MKALNRRNAIVRRLMAFATAVALSAGLAACGESGDDGGQGSATNQPGETTLQQGQGEITGQQATANVDWGRSDRPSARRGRSWTAGSTASASRAAT
jgi:hypothetical protein